MIYKTKKHSVSSRLFPFLVWVKELKNKKNLQADSIAGLFVAMTLIPHALAFASLAGLPAHYGLYAAFIPAIIAALFGSSRQLASGPVIIISLLTATTLNIIAPETANQYILYAIILALLVGIIQISLSLLKLGVIINFLSQPVVLGFTYAAVLIITVSQLDKLLGMDLQNTENRFQLSFFLTIMQSISTQIHWPTVGISILGFACIWFIKHKNPKLPYILFTVILTTLLSVVIAYNKKNTIGINNIQSPEAKAKIQTYINNVKKIQQITKEHDKEKLRHAMLEQEYGDIHPATLTQKNLVTVTKSELNKLKASNDNLFQNIKQIKFGLIREKDTAQILFYDSHNIRFQEKFDSNGWTINTINHSAHTVTFTKGGKILEQMPANLPSFTFANFNTGDINWKTVVQLLPMAIVIALIGFMESLSIAKSIAARTRQTIDTDQELLGQGLANVSAGLFHSFPVAGSFARSSINLGHGAVTTFSVIVASFIVAITLLFFTPLFYHLPLASLAVIIITSAFNLVHFGFIKQIWLANYHDGIVLTTTFIVTLLFAPHLEIGLFIGVALSLVLYLWRTMVPRLLILSKDSHGNFNDAQSNNLETCENIALVRFEGSLYFANTNYLEDEIINLVKQSPALKFIIIDGVSINEVDASGEDILREISKRMRDINITVLFSRFKKPILAMLETTNFISQHGREYFFRKTEQALEYACSQLGENHKDHCPLFVNYTNNKQTEAN